MSDYVAEGHLCAAIRDDVLKDLVALKAGWNSYGARPLGDGAIQAIRNMYVVPCPSGGVTFEWHVNGFDVEVEFSPDGAVAMLVAPVGGDA